jgi:hypothetical protein
MRGYGWIGLLVLLVAEFCLFQKIEPFYSWFYCFAWWSYILLADNLLLWLRGRSLLTGSRGELWKMLPLSVFIWLVFECYNLAINNWAYENVVPDWRLRWIGYAVAFSTVLPAIFITSDILEYCFFKGSNGPFASESQPLSPPPRTAPSRTFVLIGAALCTAPVLWPRHCFPAVWIGPILLLDPLLEKVRIRSLSVSIYSGDRRKVWSLVAGGFGCGLLWEFWNFWAPARWIYTVPFFDGMKVFEMPLFGYLGFLPFALECWIMYHLLAYLSRRSKPAAGRFAFWLTIILFSIAMFRAIDSNTVRPSAHTSRRQTTAALDPGLQTALRPLYPLHSGPPRYEPWGEKWSVRAP